MSVSPETPDQTGEPEPPVVLPTAQQSQPHSSGLPLWLRVSIITAFAVTLIVHIFVDIFVDTYEGAATSLMLGGIVGTALGINEFVKGRS